LWGDPHVLVFDKPALEQQRGPVADIFSYGDFWIVKNSLVSIQARYSSTQWTVSGQSATRAIAVGGAFLHNHTLIVQPMDGHVTWDGKQILEEVPSDFRVPGLLSLHFREDEALRLDEGQRGLPVRAVRMQLPLGVQLTVNRWSRHIDVKIAMQPLPGGQDGHCGNYNGDASDDTAEHLLERNMPIPPEELLFPVKSFMLQGCFRDGEGSRDLPVYKGLGLGLEECAQACEGYRYFGRQWRQECWCGDTLGAHGQLLDSECHCEEGSADMGDLRNCAYAFGEPRVIQAASLADCPLAVRQRAAVLCRGAAAAVGAGAGGDSSEEACIYDVCFGGEQYAAEDAAAVSET